LIDAAPQSVDPGADQLLRVRLEPLVNTLWYRFENTYPNFIGFDAGIAGTFIEGPTSSNGMGLCGLDVYFDPEEGGEGEGGIFYGIRIAEVGVEFNTAPTYGPEIGYTVQTYTGQAPGCGPYPPEAPTNIGIISVGGEPELLDTYYFANFNPVFYQTKPEALCNSEFLGRPIGWVYGRPVFQFIGTAFVDVSPPACGDGTTLSLEKLEVLGDLLENEGV
jgi:hypothetical protein